MEPMTPEERFEKIEKTLVRMAESLHRVEDIQVVAAAMQESSERRWNNQFDDLAETVGYVALGEKKLLGALRHLVEHVDELAEHMASMTERMEHLTDGQVATKAALDALIASIDKFVKGRPGNGQGPKT